MKQQQRLSVTQTRMSEQTARDFLNQHPSYIPIETNKENGGEVVWADVGEHQFTESKFRQYLNSFEQPDQKPATITTNLSLLAIENLLDSTLYPSAFIFSVHRCGSTLLAKALARSLRNNVLIEATALEEDFFEFYTDGWSRDYTMTDEKRAVLKNMILAMGRQRAPRHERYFIKFHPWQFLFIDDILQAFPDVPSIFLYRDGIEVMVSMLRTPAPVLSRIKGAQPAAFLAGMSAEETARMSDLEYYAQLHRRYLEVATAVPHSQLTFLDYKQLNRQNLTTILEDGLGYSPLPDELLIMQEQFNYYSKDNSGKATFSTDSTSKQQMASPEMRSVVAETIAPLHAQLDQSMRNLYSAPLHNRRLVPPMEAMDNASLKTLVLETLNGYLCSKYFFGFTLNYEKLFGN